MVGDKREVATTSESESDFELPNTVDDDQVYQTLVKGLTKYKVAEPDKVTQLNEIAIDTTFVNLKTKPRR